MDRLSAGPLPRPSEVAVDFSGLDPALDACCRRDAEVSLKAQSKRSRLRRHDRVAAREKSRLQAPQQQLDLPGRNPHLVTVAMTMMPDNHNANALTSFEGCRCSYDPVKDGGHDYPALAELRTSMLRPQQKPQAEFNDRDSDDDDDDDDLDAFMEGFGEGGGASRGNDGGGALQGRNVDSESDSDDDPLLSAVDNPEMTEWERQRRQQLLQQVRRMEIARQHGYGGVHRNVHPSRVLKVAGLQLQSSQPANTAARRIPPSSCVIHLYDPESTASASLDLFFEQTLAPQFLGTMFVRSDGRDTVRLERSLLLAQASSSSSSSHSHLERALTTLVEEPGESLPALLVARNGQIVGALCGFHHSEINWIDPSTGRVVPGAVQDWLEHSSAGMADGPPVLQREPPPADEVCHLRPEELALLEYLGQGASVDPRSNLGALLTARECGGQGGDDQESYYDCGLPGCRKPYSHQHVGGCGSSDPESSNGMLPFALGDGRGDPPASSSTADA